jgi:hypothetical protein
LLLVVVVVFPRFVEVPEADEILLRTRSPKFEIAKPAVEFCWDIMLGEDESSSSESELDAANIILLFLFGNHFCKLIFFCRR